MSERASMREPGPELWVRRVGRQDYEPCLRAMRAFTVARDASTADELWLLEHPAVYTLGQAGRREHVRAAGHVPVVHSDRGGQVTYHGPGQLVAYAMLDLRRLRIGVRTLVDTLEQAVIDVLAELGIAAARRRGAPGVYVEDAKIAALGLRVRNACSYHGLALNVAPDLGAFGAIDPCGYRDLAVTSLRALGSTLSVAQAGDALAGALADRLELSLVEGTGRLPTPGVQSARADPRR